jgi:succinate dehydrogenase/fumarate reductase flavoprotein subunit
LTTQYDIIIIGAGSAGMPCAIQAAARGLKVLVIEKDEKVGGTLHLTAGHISAAGTQKQKEKNITDTIDNHYQDIVSICKNTMDETITKKAVALAPHTVNWLQQLGYDFHPITPIVIHGHEPYSVARTYFGTDDYATKDISQSGKMIFKTLLPLWNKYVQAQNIKVLFSHQLKKIEKQNDAINAIEIEDILHKKLFTISINSKTALVVTTGGYAANAAFYNTVMQPYENNPIYHFPKKLLSSANKFSQGDGIKAITEVGGKFYNAEKHMSTLGGIELEPGSGRASFWDAWARVSNSQDRLPREIYVNENGERFMNEYDLSVDERERIVLQQPLQRFYVVFDEHALQSGPCIVVQWNADKFKEETKKGNCCWQADTIEALAKKIDLPQNKFCNTIENYNQSVKNNCDDLFGRSVLSAPFLQPPYYALLVYAYSLISFGGIKVNENLQVVCEDGSIIKNLFAAGEILGAGATSGNAFCGGMLLTPAVSFGKWLGDTL